MRWYWLLPQFGFRLVLELELGQGLGLGLELVLESISLILPHIWIFQGPFGVK